MPVCHGCGQAALLKLACEQCHTSYCSEACLSRHYRKNHLIGNVVGSAVDSTKKAMDIAIIVVFVLLTFLVFGAIIKAFQ